MKGEKINTISELFQGEERGEQQQNHRAVLSEFAGIYMLYKLRQQGLDARVIEAALAGGTVLEPLPRSTL